MFPPVIARGHAVMPLERTGKVHHIGEFAVVNDFLDPHIGHSQQLGSPDHLLVPHKPQRRKAVHGTEQTPEMIGRDAVLGGQLVEIEFPERVPADLIPDLADVIRIFLDPGVMTQGPADLQHEPVYAFGDLRMIIFFIHAVIIDRLHEYFRYLFRIVRS